MVRFLKILMLWGLFSVAGLAAVALGSWALVAFSSAGLVTAFLVLGLASVLPVSLAVANNVVPRPALFWRLPPSACPQCGAPFGAGPGLKPDPDSWPFL